MGVRTVRHRAFSCLIMNGWFVSHCEMMSAFTLLIATRPLVAVVARPDCSLTRAGDGTAHGGGHGHGIRRLGGGCVLPAGRLQFEERPPSIQICRGHLLEEG